VKPLAIELYAGMFGWGCGFVAEGFRVIGFDIVHEDFHGPVPDGCELVLQDVRTLHGSQFRNAAVIVGSPPGQAYSYRAMPWKRAKALGPPDNALFDACFRIQREASEAAGRHIPMIVENVNGAQRWVGRAKWHHGPWFLWGDVPALMPDASGVKKGSGSGRSWFYQNGGNGRSANSGSLERKTWTAEVSKVPFALAHHIAMCYYPSGVTLALRNNDVGMVTQNHRVAIAIHAYVK